MKETSNRDERFINIALEEAEKSNLMMQHGCVGVINGKIMARGFNSERSQSRDGLLKNSCSCHAEIDVLRKILHIYSEEGKSERMLNKVCLYIVRINSQGFIRDSAPCMHCLNMIKKLNIKKIIYGTNEGTLIKCNPKNYNTSHISNGNRSLIRRKLTEFR